MREVCHSCGGFTTAKTRVLDLLEVVDWLDYRQISDRLGIRQEYAENVVRQLHGLGLVEFRVADPRSNRREWRLVG